MLEQHAFLRKGSVPSGADWQAAIDRLGLAFQLDPTLTPFEDSGFLPCSLAGKETGFEIYYEPAESLLASYPQLREGIGDRDYAISFRWGGDMAECASVLIASA